MISKKSFKYATIIVFPTIPTPNQKYKTLTYSGKLTNKVSKKLAGTVLKIAYRTNNKLSKYIKNNKTKSSKQNKSGVYKLTCGTCPKFYIGQTGRSFEKRIKEHKFGYIKNKTNSHYALHLANDSHNFNDNFKILHTENQSLRLNLLEILEINKNKNNGLSLLNLFT